MILPQLEATPLYQQLNPKQQTLSQVLTNQTALVQKVLPVFVCPEDSAPTLNTHRLFDTLEIAKSNYVASAPNATVWDPSNPGPFGFINRGMFTGDSHVRISDIRDGTASTFLIGERRFVEEGHASVWAGTFFAVPMTSRKQLRRRRTAAHSCNCKAAKCSTLRQAHRPLAEGP